jgi:hypothetical protein
MQAATWIRTRTFCTLVAEASSRRPVRYAWQAAGSRGWLLLGICLALTAPGCGSKSKTPAPTVAADAEQKAQEPAEKPPAIAEKKPPVVAAPPAAPVRHVPQDVTKWQLADLQAALAAHDLRFVMAVLVFSVQNRNGQKEAQDLKALLASAGQMKDDPSIALPLSPAPVPATGAVTASKPVVPGQAAPPSQPAAGRKSRRSFGGGGFGGKQKPAE